MRFSEQELQAIHRLLQTDDFTLFLQGAGRITEDLNKKLVMQQLEAGNLHNLQGQTKAMVLLMEDITGAPEQLEKLAQPKT